MVLVDGKEVWCQIIAERPTLVPAPVEMGEVHGDYIVGMVADGEGCMAELVWYVRVGDEIAVKALWVCECLVLNLVANNAVHGLFEGRAVACEDVEEFVYYGVLQQSSALEGSIAKVDGVAPCIAKGVVLLSSRGTDEGDVADVWYLHAVPLKFAVDLIECLIEFE